MAEVLLLCEATISGSTYKISDRYINTLESHYEGVIISIDEIVKRMKYRYGGEVEISAGSIVIDQKFFSNNSHWPPPDTFQIKIYATTSTEAARELVLYADAWLNPGFTDFGVEYQLSRKGHELNALEEVYIYEGNSIINIRTGAYKWNLSANGSNEYYLTTSTGLDPNISEPDRVSQTSAATYMTKGTLGSLSNKEWGFGANDSQPYLTIYVRLDDSADPDTKYDGFVHAEYGTNKVPAPLVFGFYQHQELIRTLDFDMGGVTYQTYYAMGTDPNYKAKIITSIADNGSGNCRAYCIGHGYSTGNSITIEIEPNHPYNGTYSITVIDANHFDFNATFVSTESGVAYPLAWIFSGSTNNYRLYEDGVPVTGTYFISFDGRLYYAGTLSGKVTLSGQGVFANGGNLSSLMTWAAGPGYLNLTKTDATPFTLTFENFEHVVTEQMSFQDMLSEFAAFDHSWFEITDTELIVGEVGQTRDTLNLDEFDVLLSVTYEKENNPVSVVTSTWELPIAVENMNSGQFSIATKRVSASSDLAEYGTAGASALQIPGMMDAYETESGTSAFYELLITEQRLDAIAEIINTDNVVFTVDISLFPKIGDRITWTDNFPDQPISVDGHVVEVRYNFSEGLCDVVLKQ